MDGGQAQHTQPIHASGLDSKPYTNCHLQEKDNLN